MSDENEDRTIHTRNDGNSTMREVKPSGAKKTMSPKLIGGAVVLGVILIASIANAGEKDEAPSSTYTAPVVVEATVEPVAEPAVEPVEEPVAEPVEELDADTLFDMTLMLSDDPVFADPIVRDAAVAVATGFCDSLDAGLSPMTAASIYLDQASQNNVTPEQLGVILGAGVPAYCDEHTDAMNEFYAAVQ